jgi:hypothetical protein
VVFDFSKVSRGELIAGASGIALIVFMLAVHWYGIRATSLLPSELAPHGVAEGFPRVRVVHLPRHLPVDHGARRDRAAARARLRADVPRPSRQFDRGGLGLIAVVLIVLRLIDPPDLATSDRAGNHIVLTDQPGTEVIRKIGPWLGLVAALGIAVGGLTSRRPT